jgi:3-ketosteroid 9alpha-monooxygenase subunit B
MPVVGDDPRHRFYELTVFDVIRETADANSFIFEIPNELEELFRYKAGQFFTFEIPWQDFHVRRCYSLSSSPAWGDRPKVTVKRVEDGRVSNWMCDNLRQGSRIQAMPPGGHFILHHAAERTNPITLFGGGSGITPVISILKQALRETDRHVKLVYANRDRASVIFRAELEAIAGQFGDRFELISHLDDERGVMTKADIAKHIEGRLDSDFYVCGPTPFMDAIEEVLPNRPLEDGEIYVERFVSAVDPDRRPAEEAPADTSGAAAQVTIHLDGQTHQISCEAGEPILKAAVRAGVDVPFSCQDGYCGCCMAKLRDGEVNMPKHEALTRRELAGGWVLACQARPTTPSCTLEFED